MIDKKGCTFSIRLNKTRAKSILSRCLLIAAGLVAGLAVAEIALRVFGYAGERERLGSVFVPAFGAVKRDSWVVGFNIDREKQTEVRIREQVIPIDKEPGETRIIFIGDSGTEGAYVSLKETYPLQFKRLLDELHPGNCVRVVNAGVWGMTPIDEYYLLKESLAPLKPDTVVLGLFMANDINFNLGHEEKRIESRPASRLVARLRTQSALINFLYLNALALNSKYKLIDAKRLATTVLVPVDFGLVDSYGLHMLSYPAGEIATYMKKPSTLIDHAFDALRDLFRQFKSLGEKRGFIFRVALIPSPSALVGKLAILHHPDILNELRDQGITIKDSDLDFEKPTRRVLEICKELAIECFDPIRRMRRMGGLSMFFPGDEHLTELGHKTLAKELVGDKTGAGR